MDHNFIPPAESKPLGNHNTGHTRNKRGALHKITAGLMDRSAKFILQPKPQASPRKKAVWRFTLREDQLFTIEREDRRYMVWMNKALVFEAGPRDTMLVLRKIDTLAAQHSAILAPLPPSA